MSLLSLWAVWFAGTALQSDHRLREKRKREKFCSLATKFDLKNFQHQKSLAITKYDVIFIMIGLLMRTDQSLVLPCDIVTIAADSVHTLNKIIHILKFCLKIKHQAHFTHDQLYMWLIIISVSLIKDYCHILL